VRFSATLVLALPLLAVSACALFPSWHWVKPGAGAAEYKADETQCKAEVYSGTDSFVSKASVRRMHACLESRGWRKQPS
jgi:hypothetical protein